MGRDNLQVQPHERTLLTHCVGIYGACCYAQIGLFSPLCYCFGTANFFQIKGLKPQVTSY
jgi:hypothetical protein